MFKKFLESKNLTLEQFKALEIEKQADIQREYLGGLESQIKDKASVEDIASSLKSFKKENEIETFKGLISNIEADLLVERNRINKLAEKKKEIVPSENVSYKKSILNMLNEQKEGLHKMKTGQGQVTMITKVPVDVGLSNTIFSSGSDSQVEVTQNTGIISTIRSRVLTYLQNVSVAITTGTKIMWVEETDEQGAVIPVAEMATKPNISVIYVEKDQEMKKYPAFTKVSTEMIDDAPQLVAAVQNNVIKRLNLKVEKDLFMADGTSNSITGINTYATAFTGGSLADSVQDPNNYDVVKGIALQVFEAHGNASAIFLTPAKLAEMEVSKATDGQYIMPPFSTADGTQVSGVRLIPTTALIGEDIDFVGGDLSVVNVRIRQDVRTEMNRSGDDMINNKMTILVETRLGQFVSANDTALLVKGTFEAAKALLDSAV